jgi:hypothetical protein
VRPGTYLSAAQMVKKANQRVVIVGEGLGMLNGMVQGVSHGSSEGHVAGTFLRRHPSSTLNLLSPPPRKTMSVSLNPSSALGFRRACLPRR